MVITSEVFITEDAGALLRQRSRVARLSRSIGLHSASHTPRKVASEYENVMYRPRLADTCIYDGAITEQM